MPQAGTAFANADSDRAYAKKVAGMTKSVLGKTGIAGTAATKSRKKELVLLVCFCCIPYDL